MCRAHFRTQLAGAHWGMNGFGMNAERPSEPFALRLLKEYQRGKPVETLSLETGIPPERIEMRLKAATAYRKEHPQVDARIPDR